MPTWAKILVAVLVLGVLIFGVLVFLGIRWMRREFNTMKTEGPRLAAEAQEFGRGKDAQACVAESLARVQQCDGFICEAKVKVFLEHCLPAATTSPELCRGVPQPTEFVKAVKWVQEECSRRGLPTNERCTRLISTLQVHCAATKR